MKAIVYTRYGSPDVLELQEVARPTPADNEVLVKVYASAVTPTDCAFLKADPFMTRFMNGLLKPKYQILGNVFAGEVEAVGKQVKLFKPGDAVFGSMDTDFGAHAEYKCLKETGLLAIKPGNMTYEEAVGLPEALTGEYFLKNLAKVQPGQKVLINGASGAVGTYAVQLGKELGAKVTGVCSTRNVELVKSLGADHVIDYTREDFTRSGQTYDVIFDTVGKRSFSECQRVLTPDGLYLSTAPGIGILLQMLRTARFSRQKAIVGFAGLNPSKEALEFIRELAEAGKLKSVIDRCYPLEQIAEAYRYVETGRKRGNVVITVKQSKPVDPGAKL
jgi:NADPH:quinone reductase-like Zn-dependent oxidoreductase